MLMCSQRSVCCGGPRACAIASASTKRRFRPVPRAGDPDLDFTQLWCGVCGAWYVCVCSLTLHIYEGKATKAGFPPGDGLTLNIAIVAAAERSAPRWRFDYERNK